MPSSLASWVTAVFALSSIAVVSASSDATAHDRVFAQLKLPSTGPTVPKPLRPALKPASKSVQPQLLSIGACGVAQVQCFVAGGRVPANAPPGSPASFRMKKCVRSDDPYFGCGTCDRCPLYQTVGAFCGPNGCDYKSCAPGWVDEDRDRKNGCEVFRPGVRPPVQPPPGDPCKSDADCGYLSDKYGRGRCARAAGVARDARGCFYDRPTCGPYSEILDGQCFLPRSSTLFDADGDGELSPAFGGADCDDSDPAAFPGNSEVCDAHHHDEDCDATTFGQRDGDGDGAFDARCCNVSGRGVRTCGVDCDDGNPALKVGDMRCTASGEAEVCVDGGWEKRVCPLAGTRCIPQPNGTGVCR